MGVTKSELFSDKKNKLLLMYKVLGHLTRIAILQYIINQDACICNDLVEELGLAQATISQHLKELKNSGLIKGTIEGKSVCYCIDDVIWKEFFKEFEFFFAQKIESNDCC